MAQPAVTQARRISLPPASSDWKIFCRLACHRAKLIVELDGGHHAEPAQMEHDEERTKFLKSVGYRVFRFWNFDSFKNEAAIAEYIASVAKRLPTRSASLCSTDRPPLVGGGGD